VLAPNGTVAVYGAERGVELELDVRELMVRNVRYAFVLVYTVHVSAKDQAVADVVAAVADGALPVGEDAGLPLHRFPLERTADAHAAVEDNAVGKVLIDV
jgi:NADPH2:quinone reductase